MKRDTRIAFQRRLDDAIARALGPDAARAARAVTDADLWEHVAQRAWQTGMGGLLHQALQAARVVIPASAARQLEADREHVAAANRQRLERVLPITDAFASTDIDCRCLKGAALLATLYDDISLRPMTDVDLLIRPGDAARAERILLQNGWRPGADLVRPDFYPRFHYEREYIPVEGPPARIDLHVRPFRPLRYAATVPDTAFWSRPQRAALGGVTITIPDPEAMFIHLAVHAACHGADALRWLYDVHCWAERHRTRIGVGRLVERCIEWGLAWPMRRALNAVCRRFPHAPLLLRTIRDRLPRRAGLLDRMALRQAPHGAGRPVIDVCINTMCTPGIARRAAYLAAVTLPSAEHLGQIYDRRHIGWQAAAVGARLARIIARLAPRAA